ncbi:extracellular solute-binding protein [Kushneria aurantia]|uniref:Extracellular solute-binding protein n=1 Tax=Kushneria aurantia TaxID=504092 RepID=A0ABV6G2D0_9GAMM|nr:extracellular solute-binding protein [Kushneria aurantia]
MIFLRKRIMAIALASMILPGTVFAQQHISWWDFFVGGDGVRMKALTSQFNDEHADINIDATSLEWGVPFYTKVRTSVAIGQGPDIMSWHLSRLPLGLEEGVLSPITDHDLEVAGLSRSDFFPHAIEAASGPDGQLYAVPFDIHALVLYYNKRYLQGTDYLDASGRLTGIDSLEDFESAMAAAARNGSRVPLSYGTSEDAPVFRIFFTLLKQMGGILISPDGEILPGDSTAKATRAIEIMTHWFDEGWQPEQTSYEASVALFTSGEAAFMLNGVWEVPTVKDLAASGKLGFDWGVVQVPMLLDQPASWADSHAFAIPANARNPMSPQKREAVMTAIGWMERHSLEWAGAGHIPAYKPVAESSEFQQMEPNATYSALVDTAMYDPRSPIAGVASPVYDAAVNILAPAINGYLSPEQAIAQFKSELQSRQR